MRKLVVVCFVFCLLVFTRCATQKVEYAIPDDAKELDGYAELMDHLGKGKKLYKSYCTDCHGVLTKGKKDIPNFSQVQLDNYNSKFIKKDPKNHAVAQNLSPEQLNDIILFLTFIKRENKK